MDRAYTKIIDTHFTHNRQMLFLSGPRQVGKTTLAKLGTPQAHYLNWDTPEDRLRIIGNQNELYNKLGLNSLSETATAIIFDEIHKYPEWKNFLKGFFDTHQNRTSITVTGSARLDTYKRGGDSLMGRYLLYRVHPFSVGELAHAQFNDEQEISLPTKSNEHLENLITFGGFPEPLLKGNKRFSNQWKRLRLEQLFREEVRDTSKINEIAQLQLLGDLLRHSSGAQINYSTLASSIGISVDTVRRWIEILESLYYCFSIRPWYTNVAKSLRKQPKIYLWDWSHLEDEGARVENLIASHLLKAVHFWTDHGFGTYGLHYLRDTAKREVDFLITKDNHPWFMVEAKTSENATLNPSLTHFQKQIKCPHAFQVSLNATYVEKNCFEETGPIKVPAKTLLSQLP